MKTHVSTIDIPKLRKKAARELASQLRMVAKALEEYGRARGSSKSASVLEAPGAKAAATIRPHISTMFGLRFLAFPASSNHNSRSAVDMFDLLAELSYS